MADVVLKLGSIDTVDENALVQAIDNFARWRQATAGSRRLERDAPDLMVKTQCNPDGSLSKAIIFQEQSWASAFMNFWDNELEQTG